MTKRAAVSTPDLDFMGRRLAALVARRALVTLGNEEVQACVVVTLARGPGKTFLAPTVAEAVAEAWSWAVEQDPALVGMGLVLGVP